MRPVLMVVTDVLTHQSFQMPFVENDDMVEQVPTAVPDSTLRDAILPRTLEAGPFGLDPEASDCVDHFFIEVRSAIKDQEFRGRVERKCLAQLLSNPGRGRMFGHIAMENSPPTVRNDEEAVENAEGERRYDEEIDRKSTRLNS